mgnify:CR=1 FL=1
MTLASLFKINPIRVLEDNIIWVWSIGKLAIVIDPAVTSPVEEWLKANDLKLIAIFQTHHHLDHIGGTQGLIKIWPKASVVASGEDFDRIPFQTISVNDGDQIKFMGQSVRILKVNGHTKNHIAFYIPANSKYKTNPILFCGDTLFGAGCGRLFEGSPEDMYDSLKRINLLPAETKIYCAHEYTRSNLRWALHLYPKDLSLKSRLLDVEDKIKRGSITLPSTLKEERKTNLFIKAKNPKELSILRINKDNWKG